MESEVGMSSSESPELIRLFHTYTGASSSIGAHLGALAARSTASDPLIVATGTEVLEGDWRPQLVVVHHWRSRADFNAFWNSDEYQPLRRLRHTACDSRIVVFDAFIPPARGLPR